MGIHQKWDLGCFVLLQLTRTPCLNLRRSLDPQNFGFLDLDPRGNLFHSKLLKKNSLFKKFLLSEWRGLVPKLTLGPFF